MTTITTTRSRNSVNAALEKSIVANPYDDAAYMVYADWLQAQGDPRGDLIAIQAAGKTDAAKQLLAEHVEYFLGPLAEHQETHDDRLQNNGRINTPEWIAQNKQAFLWKNGFIHRLRLGHAAWDESFKGTLAKDVLAPVLAHPSGKFIVEIAINENGEVADNNVQDIIDVLAAHAPPTLRKLHVGDNVDQISWYHVGDLSNLWAAVPRLTWLEIEAGAFTLGTLDLPNLERAVFITGGLVKASMTSIATARWPRLAHLEVYIGDEDNGATTQVEDVLPLLDRTDLMELRYLGVKNAEFQDALVPYLATSKIVKQLETLDISKGILTDDSVDLFDTNAFAHLTIDVSETYLSKAAQAKLASICRRLVANNMRDDDPEYRYVRVGE